MRRAFVAIAVLSAILLALHWLPGRQVRLHQKRLEHAVEGRQWKVVGELVAGDYRDRWSQTKPVVLARLPQAFSDFLACGILAGDEQLEWTGGAAKIRSRIRVVGSGGPIAQFLMNEVAALKQPFAFTWRRQSWKPWDWRLESVDQPEIEIPAEAAEITP